MRTDVKKQHTQQYQHQIDGFCLEILLVEEGCPKEETDHHRAAPNHGDDTDHSIGQRQGVEIEEVCRRKENADAYYAPFPTETRYMVTLGPPQQQSMAPIMKHW